jgi:hypothetical protein
MKNSDFYILWEFKETARPLLGRQLEADTMRAACTPFYERLLARGHSHYDALDLMRSIWIDLAKEGRREAAQ